MENNNNLTTLNVRVEHIVSSTIYQLGIELDVNQSLLIERTLKAIKGKEVGDSYIVKVVKDMLTKHRHDFDRKGYDITSLVVLHQTLKKYNYEGEWKALIEIEYIVKHALLEFPITKDEMDKTIIAIAQYSFDRQENNYEMFKKYLLKSKVLKKSNPPLQVFEKMAQRFVDEYGNKFDKPNTEIDYAEIPLDDLYKKMCSSCPKAKECHDNCETCEKFEIAKEKLNVKR